MLLGAADATKRRLLTTGNPDMQASSLLLAGLLMLPEATDATRRRLLTTGNPDMQASRLLLAGLLMLHGAADATLLTTGNPGGQT